MVSNSVSSVSGWGRDMGEGSGIKRDEEYDESIFFHDMNLLSSYYRSLNVSF